MPMLSVRKEAPLPAYKWHAKRRREMLAKYPQMEKLFRTKVDDIWNGIILILLGSLQALTAYYCANYPFWLTVLLASTVGAFAAHGIQALTHEMCHSVGKSGGRVKIFGVGVGNICTRAACATTNFPWSMYYEQYHTKHHSYTGTQPDADGIILFRSWHQPPLSFFKDTTVGKILWTAIFSVLIYPSFCIHKKLLDTAHPPSVNYEGVAVAFQLFIYMFGGGSYGLVYLHLSAAFSLGALCHPYWGFWLIQHMPNKDGTQLTLSYTGSRLWHILNFGELYHVEHHDFPRIPWTRLHLCQEIAPEYYKDLDGRDSIIDAIREWVVMDNAKWMERYGDFAGWQSYMKRRGRI
jgi:sphingolipid delta-4 desaturase